MASFGVRKEKVQHQMEAIAQGNARGFSSGRF
jgi:hypothetical protein